MNRLRQKLQTTGRRTLLGVAVQRYDPVFVEVAAHLGFDAMWIEMEHEALTLDEAGDLCRIASAMGLLTMIRVNGPMREQVLKAAELDPDILDLPMANTPEISREFVGHARFAPLGNRGFYGGSRALRYGLAGKPREEQQRVNDELCLLVQVETKEAVDCLEATCEIPGLDGVFLGPGDLSVSFGVTGETAHPLVHGAMEHTIRTARSKGKLVAVACSPTEFGHWSELGADLMFCGGNVGSMVNGLRSILATVGDARR